MVILERIVQIREPVWFEYEEVELVFPERRTDYGKRWE